jgi:hypothetical protein
MNFPAFNKRLGRMENKISDIDNKLDKIVEEVRKWQAKK